MMSWDKVADKESIERTVEALKQNGIGAIVVENGEEATKKALELLPKQAEVLTMTSVTLDTIGLALAINESKEYKSVRNELTSMDRNTQNSEMQKIGSAPEYTVGSVHAVTEDGKVMIASNTGSQLPAYAFGSGHVIWVVGGQKIVKDLDSGFKRVFEYVLPLETQRARIAYGQPDTFHSNVSKLLIVNKELVQGRITIILVKEVLGF